MKGLSCSIFKNPLFKDCANGGLSERVNNVIIVVTDEQAKELSLPFEPSESHPAVKLVKRTICGELYVHAEPINPPPKGMVGWCAGGTFIETSDSRYSKIVGHPYPIPLHDRCDTEEDFEALTR